MKTLLYKFINRLGYKISNRRKLDKQIRNRLASYRIEKNLHLAVLSSSYIFLFEDAFKEFDLSDRKEGLLVSFNGLSFYVESKEEFHILKEIFYNRDYEFHLHQKCIVIDIGANVGFSTLFFSQLDQVHEIYAFEPVKDTYNAAAENFSGNNISKIAEFHNFGLGNKEREEDFLFSSLAKGNSGIRGVLSPGYRNKKDLQVRKVKIRDASEILDPIIRRNKGNYKIVVKMDCEGAEYEIMENLKDSGLLAQIDLLMMEWHDKGSTILEEHLNEDFTFFSRNFNPHLGMITAVRK